MKLAPVRDLDELRRTVLARRNEETAGALEGDPAEASSEASRLETLLRQIETYQNVLDFDLTSPVPVLGPPLTLLKRLFRRALRSYIRRQTAFNEYCLALCASIVDEQSRRARASLAEIERLELRVAELEESVASSVGRAAFTARRRGTGGGCSERPSRKD